MGVGGVIFSRKKRYEGVRFNVICVTRGWVGVPFSEKKALHNTLMAPYTVTHLTFESVKSVTAFYTRTDSDRNHIRMG